MESDRALGVRGEPAQQAGPRKLMLVMNDDPDFFALVSTLRGAGWEVSVCGDAVSAQGRARAEQPAVILVGGNLAAGGASTAIGRLKRNVHTSSITVLGVTGTGSGGDALFAEADGCLSLEMGADELCRVLDGHLGGGPVPMTAPAAAIEDPARLAALRATSLLDETFDADIDALTEIAARLLDVPVALLSLVEHDRQYFKSFVGLEDPWATLRQTDLPHSFCQWVVSSDEQLVVADARQHPVLSRNLAVHDLGVTAYAGVPVRSASGYALGSMCAIDSKPRSWSETESQTLHLLSSAIEALALALPAEMSGNERLAAQQTLVRGVRGGVRLLRESWANLFDSQRMQLLDLVDQLSARLVAVTV